MTNRVEIENDRDDAQEVEEEVEEEGMVFVSNFFHSVLPFLHRGHKKITSNRYESILAKSANMSAFSSKS